MLVPSLCPQKQGQLEQVSQDHVLNISGSEYFQGWSLYSLSGQPVSGFEHPYNATGYIHKHLADEEFKTTHYSISLLRNDLPGLKKSSVSPCKGIRDYSAMINIFSSEFLTPK